MCPAPDRHGVQLVNVLKALAPRYAVDVLTLRAGTMPFQERFMKTRMLRVPVVGALTEQVEAFRRAIRRQLEGEEYDVIHLRSAWGGRAVLAGGPTAKLVYEIARSTEGEPRAANAALADALAAEEQVCVGRAALILAPTEAARAHLAARGMGDKVEVVPPGVDVDHFDWEPSTAPDETPRVLYAGQIAGGRGVRLLLRAMAMVKRHRRVKLDPGRRRRRELRAGARRRALPRWVSPPTTSSAWAPSITTTCRASSPAPPSVSRRPRPTPPDRPLASFPTKLLEYMACRRPVVAPRRPPVTEIITDGENGLLFTGGDDRDLARALERILDDQTLREKLSGAGYERVRREHPASATRRRILEAYARLLPPSSWSPPMNAVAPIDALPSHPDTTTARRPLPDLVDGRAEGELSGEFVMPEPPPPPLVEAGEIVIEIDALSEYDMLREEAEELAAAEAITQQVAAPSTPPNIDQCDTIPISTDHPMRFDSDGSDEKTEPGPLRPRNGSG